jgi:hypothetical protein
LMENILVCTFGSAAMTEPYSGYTLSWSYFEIAITKVHLSSSHGNELLLRHVFTMLDGVTNGPDSFSGPIGEAVEDLRILRIHARMIWENLSYQRLILRQNDYANYYIYIRKDFNGVSFDETSNRLANTSSNFNPSVPQPSG